MSSTNTNLEIRRLVYYSCFQFIISYGVILWGKSTYCKIIFKRQKKLIRIMTHSLCRQPYKPLSKELHYLVSIYMNYYYTRSHHLPFNSCWNVRVLHNLPPNTDQITRHHLELAYQFVLSSRLSPGINLR